MKLVYKSDEVHVDHGLQVIEKTNPCLDASWHYHQEFELIYISKSFGIRYVGDNVSHFGPGELVLIGSNLPHLWRNDSSYYRDQIEGSIRTVVIKFTREFMGEDTFDKGLFHDINEMLILSKFGIKFDDSDSATFKEELYELLNMNPTEQALALMGILNRLTRLRSREILSTTDMRQSTSQGDQRIDKVLKFISDNYKKEICLEDVADVACMTTNSFCRFFRKVTNKSFVRFLNEVRIKNAARLLSQEDLLISDICFKVGFNSITNFNKHFKYIMGVSPNEHRCNLQSDEYIHEWKKVSY